MRHNGYNEQDFIQLLGETYKASKPIHEVYMTLLADKLSKETSFSFSVYNDCITNYGLGISISSKDIKGYKDLKEQVNKYLSNCDNQEIRLKNEYTEVWYVIGKYRPNGSPVLYETVSDIQTAIKKARECLIKDNKKKMKLLVVTEKAKHYID